MLEQLTIKHIALIDDVTIRFHEGLQVLTGETGAGKSIVVDAVNLILGGRADRNLIRTGEEKASVEALFDIRDHPAVLQYMEKQGITEFDGSTVSVYREISSSGKNICRICGLILPLSALKELSPLLLDIHGQNDHWFLTDPKWHLAYLDQTGNDQHRALLRQVEQDFALFIENHRTYARLMKKNEGRENKLNSLNADIIDLKKAGIQPGEADKLMRQRNKLSSDMQTAETYRQITDAFSGDDESSSLAGIKKASDLLTALAGKDESLKELSERCESLYYELEEVAYQIHQKQDRLNQDPAALDHVDQRLELIHRLERRFGSDADSFSGLLGSLEDEYQQYQEMEKTLSLLSAEHKKLLSAYRASAKKLTESRKHLAHSFETKLMKELSDLGMEKTIFEVCFKENDTGKPLMPSAAGDDKAEFMISPNPGEPVKPLAQIASGGELSRMMLALKTLESEHSGVESMVFDEIDTGISGRMAQAVAEKMIRISRKKQVICVSHLPQIAAAADHHFLVRKTVTDERTRTTVTELDRTGRVEEVGRMISGADGISSESQNYADRLVAAAEMLKSSGIFEQ